MIITQFRVENYKAFQDSGVINFSPGINIIVGKNNVGKTTLLETLTLDFESVPHLNPNKMSQRAESSSAKVTFLVRKEELLKLLPKLQDELRSKLEKYDGTDVSDDSKINIEDKAARELENWLNSINVLEIDVHLVDRNIHEVEPTLPYLGTRQVPGVVRHHAQMNYLMEQGPLALLSYFSKQGSSPGIRHYLLEAFKERTYRFRAERFVSDTYLIAENRTLKLNSDTSNLAGVLSLIQGERPKLFEQLNEYLSFIFPDIRRISVRQKDIATLEILVWFRDFQDDELPFTLSSCGTGVGQVLAILYVVLTSQDASFIIIDEPQSFLHPGAAKDLMEVLQCFPQHQYFISTHSSTIINAANPSSIIMLHRKNFETFPKVLDKSNLIDLRSMLNDIGFKLSDVFGADKIIWVEGPTEAECFPNILRRLGRKLFKGIEILPIVATGDLEKKRSTVILEIYEKLSIGKSIIPPTLGFLLDSEDRTPKDKQDLERWARNIGKQLSFLPYRMYENYLLHADAIAAVLNQEDTGKIGPLDATEITSWLDKNKEKYYSKKTKPEQWVETVDGAKLLADCFTELTESRVEFKKTKHSVQLTDWLIEHQPQKLDSLKDFLLDVIKSLKAK